MSDYFAASLGLGSSPPPTPEPAAAPAQSPPNVASAPPVPVAPLTSLPEPAPLSPNQGTLIDTVA